MLFIEKQKAIMMKDMLDYIGVPAFIISLLFNLAKLLTDININFWLLIITSFCGIVYVVYKIFNEHKTSRLTNMQIKNEELKSERQKLEIEKLKNNE